jgi:hypothetical protein
MKLGNWLYGAIVLVAFSSLVGEGAAQSFSGVLTWHNDNARTGQNIAETTLTPANVNVNQFGKLFSYPVDGQVYAQPLYAPDVNTEDGTYNLVFVATEHDTVYAFDADGVSPAPVWRTSFISPRSVMTMPCTSSQDPGCDPSTITPERGITATPVIDAASGTIYVIAKTVENGTYTYKLHALDITNGAERPNSPVVIDASAPGHPDVKFDSVQGLDRAGLALTQGQVIIPFNSPDSDHGWLMAYNATTLTQTAVFCVTPTGRLGAIWGSGAAPAVDSQGNIYFMTGNGTFDANVGGENYSMSMLKMSLQKGSFRISDYFTPYNEAPLSRDDYDLASGGVMLLPDQAGPHKHEATGGFKTGQVLLVDRDNMGKFNGRTNHIVQSFTDDQNGFWSSPAYWNGRVYWAGGGSYLHQFNFSNGKYVVPPGSKATELLIYPGATPSVSANGTKNGIVWIIENLRGQPLNNPPALLRAYDATNVATELYNSKQNETRDQAGPAVKFTVPMIADGKVYIGTQTELDVYGLLP